MGLLNRVFESSFKKAMNQTKHLFCSWEQKYSKDDYQEIFVFTKDKTFIIFAEDLREHSIEFKVYNDTNCIIEAGYKTVVKSNIKFEIESMKKELETTKTDVEELNIYLKFLTNNHLL